MATKSRRANSHSLPVRSRPKSQLLRAATSPAAIRAYTVIGLAGVTALAIAMFGPKRFQREILKPVQHRVSDQAGQLWADSRPLREQIGKLFERVQSESGRERLVKSFQSWIGHFKAT
ncbi:MAG TPA: hypothetical protein VG501_04280 [Rhizomicrobium sp.]|nr:hypothetical protein [Rhizomicrobium sp.]